MTPTVGVPRKRGLSLAIKWERINACRTRHRRCHQDYKPRGWAEWPRDTRGRETVRLTPTALPVTDGPASVGQWADAGPAEEDPSRLPPPPPAAASHLEHRLLVLAVLNLGCGQVEHKPLHGVLVAVVHVGVGPPHHHEALGPASRVRLQEVQVPLLGDDRAGDGDAPKPSFCSCPPGAQPPPGTGSGSGPPSCPLCLLILHPCPRSGGPARPPAQSCPPS